MCFSINACNYTLYKVKNIYFNNELLENSQRLLQRGPFSKITKKNWTFY